MYLTVGVVEALVAFLASFAGHQKEEQTFDVEANQASYQPVAAVLSFLTAFRVAGLVILEMQNEFLIVAELEV